MYYFLLVFHCKYISVLHHLVTGKLIRWQKYYRKTKHMFACEVAVHAQVLSCKVVLLRKTGILRNVLG